MQLGCRNSLHDCRCGGSGSWDKRGMSSRGIVVVGKVTGLENIVFVELVANGTRDGGEERRRRRETDRRRMKGLSRYSSTTVRLLE
ncbi:unnamed protein product [Camellia sinensis]